MSCTLTFVYNANGGSGAAGTSGQTFNFNSFPQTGSKAIAGGSPTREYYDFIGWSRSSSATSASYQNGSVFSQTFTYDGQTVVITFYAVWKRQQVTLSYNANGGSGAPASRTVFRGGSYEVSTQVPTRANYDFAGWAISANATVPRYQPGDDIAMYANTTLYAVWELSTSVLESYTSTLAIDGVTQGTLQITRYNTNYTHAVIISLGSSSETYENVATSLTYTLPSSWVSELPNSVSGSAIIRLLTYNGTTFVGEKSYTFEATVPDSIVPSFTVVSTFLNDNQTVDGWGILLQGFSKLRMVVTASAGTGASVSTYAFSGPGISQVGSSNSCDTSVISESGSKSWHVIVTDSRGRVAESDVTHTVYEYSQPSSSLSVVRCNSDGTVNNYTGNYLKVIAIFSCSSADGNNAVSATIKYKQSISSSWTVAQQSAVSGTAYIVGQVTLISYDVKVETTDALNTTFTQVTVPSVLGFGYGLNNDRACFGGPCEEAGLVTKWPFKAKDGIYIGQNNTPLLDIIYPVGSIYMSVNAVSPASFFGGTWQQIEDTFLLAAGSTYTAGATGGEAAHTLIGNELPNITGSFSFHKEPTYGIVKNVTGVFSGTTTQGTFGTPNESSGSGQYDKNVSNVTLNIGGGQAHNNMPPYLVVYMWKRIA